jgi:hypothetical protein
LLPRETAIIDRDQCPVPWQRSAETEYHRIERLRCLPRHFRRGK